MRLAFLRCFPEKNPQYSHTSQTAFPFAKHVAIKANSKTIIVILSLKDCKMLQ